MVNVFSMLRKGFGSDTVACLLMISFLRGPCNSRDSCRVLRVSECCAVQSQPECYHLHTSSAARWHMSHTQSSCDNQYVILKSCFTNDVGFDRLLTFPAPQCLLRPIHRDLVASCSSCACTSAVISWQMMHDTRGIPEDVSGGTGRKQPSNEHPRSMNVCQAECLADRSLTFLCTLSGSSSPSSASSSLEVTKKAPSCV